ncbi:MAG: HAD family phosphatase [Endomicrobium sp.]|jgi:putative hydrolase of the HAD superfamily|uniref:HAD family hydrolase n=1 Tax=Candidatus Endomicrobiellum cubanum TaxID=3242325 RepID=UPI0028389643|nr:HAD family phosphatase [Endomicrobium sp.]
MSDKIIIFDLGNVIFKFDLFRFIKLYIKKVPDDKKITDFNALSPNCLKTAQVYETGDISSLDFYDQLAKEMHYTGTYNEFAVVWNNIFELIPETVDVIASLSGRYHLGILSNTNELHFNFLKERYPQVFSLFDKIFLSYEMRLRKPDREIFENVIKHYNVLPSKIFFSDDLERNIHAAQETGIKAYVYTNTMELVKQLKQEQIEI